MAPLTVLHIDTERGWRGGERQAFWLARELARRGHRSLVAARPDEPFAARCREAGLTVMACSPRGGVDPGAAWALRGALARERVDIVHAHTSHGATLGAMATLGTAVPLIIARRVDFPLRGGLAARWKYGRAAAIIAVSRGVQRVLERSGIASNRIAVVPDGTDVHRPMIGADTETLALCGVPPGAPLVVQVAQLVPHKDPVTFVRAMRVVVDRLPGAHALMVGDGPLHAQVDDMIRLLDLRANVHLLGYRTDADALLAAADVVTLSSAEEGMGSVLLDALVAGKAVAATSAGGIPEVVIPGETGFLSPPGVSAMLGVAIAKLLEDTGLRTSMGEAARRRAAQFSVERMTDLTVAIYERVLTAVSPVKT